MKREKHTYNEKIYQLVTKHKLEFHINPGGAEFYSKEFGRCQVPFMDEKEDYEKLSSWLEEKLNSIDAI